MKKTLLTYTATLALIFLSYFIFALIFASLFHYAHLQPTFYNVATRICSYSVIFIASLGFGLMCEEKRLWNGLIFCIIFSLLATLLLWHHLNWKAIFLKDIVFIGGIFIVNLLKK